MKYKIVVLAALAALLPAAAILCSGESETYQQDGVYTFTLNDINGNTVNFTELRGKGVLLNIWATWCGPCKDEIPVFIHLYEKYKDRNFVIWGVSTDIEGRKVVEPFIREMGVNYPVLLGSETELRKIFGYMRGYPTTLFFDAGGRLVHRISGEPFVDKDSGETLESVFEREIKKILPR